jgi:MFS family permease
MNTLSKRIVLILSLVTMIAALGAGLITPIFSIYLYDNLSYSVLTIGLIYSIYTIALAVFPIPFGIFSDKKGRKPTAALGLLGYAISYLFRIFATKPEEFGVLSALEGLGDASFKPAAQSAIADVVASDERGSAYGIYNAAASGAIIVGFLLSGIVVVWFTSFFISFMIGGLLSIVSLVVLLLLLKETLGLDTLENSKFDLKRIFREKFRRPIFIYLLAIMVGNFGVAAILPILSIFVIYQYNIPLYFIGVVWFAYMIASTISSIPTGKLCDLYSSKNTMGLGLLVTAISFYLLGTQSTIVLLIVSSILFGIGSAMIFNASTTYMMNLTETEIRGRTVSVFNVLKMAGGALGPIVSGILWERFAPQYSFIIPAIAIFVAGVFFLIIGIPDKEIKKLMGVYTN